jgi:hypothetical protein
LLINRHCVTVLWTVIESNLNQSIAVQGETFLLQSFGVVKASLDLNSGNKKIIEAKNRGGAYDQGLLKKQKPLLQAAA